MNNIFIDFLPSILFFLIGILIVLISLLKQSLRDEKRAEILKEEIRKEWRCFLKNNNGKEMPPNSIIFGYRNLTFEVLQENTFLSILKTNEN